MSYLEGVLPPNKMVADRRLVAQGKKAKAELNELKKEAKQKERTGALNSDSALGPRREKDVSFITSVRRDFRLDRGPLPLATFGPMIMINFQSI